MAIRNVCRLCLTTDDLVWIFDKRFESSDNMKDVIYITTGVEITINDIVSQKICKKCCQVTIKMFEFRRTSLKNDQQLKEQCRLLLRDKELKIPNTQVTIRSEVKNSPVVAVENNAISKNDAADAKNDAADAKNDAVDTKKEAKRQYKIHPSVRKLFKDYPQIKLPTVSLKYNIAPCVSMKMDAVEQYFTSRKLDFQKCTKLALRSGRVATKRTSSVLKSSSLFPKTSVSSKIIKPERKNKTEVKEYVAPLKIKLPSSDDVPAPNAKPSSSSEGQNTSSKRKFSEVAKVEKKEFIKTDFIESLGLTPKPEMSLAPPSVVTNKSEPLYICEICNSVEYSHKDLRKHQNKHLRCQFCKMRFRSLESKDEHLSTMCPIKNMMNNLPDVKLQKVDSNEWARSRYPEAFELQGPTSSLETMECDTDVGTVEPADSKDVEVHKEIEAPSGTLDPCEIIDITSDDDDSLPPFSNDTKEQSFTDNSTTGQSLVPKLEGDANGKRGGRLDIVYNTVSIVRPDIKIKGSSALDMIDARLTDIKVLKELLTHYKPVRLYDEKNVQTELPANEAIRINRSDMSAELKLLKPQLHVYKVPIVIKNGVFNVSFKYTTWQKPQKKLCLWNDLSVIDVRPPNVRTAPKVILNESVANQKILPSTATYTFTGLVNRPQVTPTTSKFIRVNTSALSPITTTSYTLPSSSTIVVNSLLNSALQNAAAFTATTAAHIPNLEPSVVRSEQPVDNNGPAVVTSAPSSCNSGPLIVNSEPTVVNSGLPVANSIPTVLNSGLSIVNTGPTVDSGVTIVDSAPLVNSELPGNSVPPASTVPSVPGQFGSIRVKNVWELT